MLTGNMEDFKRALENIQDQYIISVEARNSGLYTLAPIIKVREYAPINKVGWLSLSEYKLHIFDGFPRNILSGSKKNRTTVNKALRDIDYIILGSSISRLY